MEARGAGAPLTVRLSGVADPPTRRRFLVPVIGTGVVAAAVAAVSWWHRWATSAPTGVVNLLVATSFAVTAAVLYSDVEQRASAREIGFAALLYLLSWGWGWPPEWQRTPLAVLSFVGGYLWFVVLGSALTRFPHPRFQHRYERTLLVAFAVWVVGLKLLLVATTRPAWTDYHPGAWWLPLASDRAFSTAVNTVFQAGLVGFVLGLLVLLAIKIRRGIGVDRVDAAPAVVAAGTIAIAGVAYLVVRIVGSTPAVSDALRVATAVAALGTPLSFLAVAVRRHTIRAAAADVLPRIYSASSPRRLREELRHTLRDPELRLWLWHGERHQYLDVDGRSCELDDEVGRSQVRVRSAGGEPLAVIGMRSSLRRHGKLVVSSAYALGIAVERQADVRRILASDARVGEAAADARRQLARDLHDGAQQILLTALLRLALARRDADAGTSDAIDEARAHVDAALRTIRGLVSGRDPGAGRHLGESLVRLTGGMEIPVEVSVTADEVREPIERAVWFVVAEALTNVRKHADASAAAVSVDRVADEIVARVVDDGRGGAVPRAEGGLAGIAERVRDLAGSVCVTSPAGVGTTVVVRFPCA